MVKRLIITFVFLIFLLQIAGATETEIKVKTMPYHEVQLTTHKSDVVSFIVIDRFINDSNAYGDVIFTTQSSDAEFNIIVYIKKDNEKIMGPEKFLNNPAGEPVYLEIAPDWFQFIETPGQENQTTENETEQEASNETEQEIEESEQEVGEEKTKTTGSAISEGTGFSKKVIFYGIGAIVLLVVIILAVGFFIEYEILKKIFRRRN